MKARRSRRPSCVGARQSAHGRRRPAPAYVRAAAARDADGGIGNLGAILGFGGSLGAWAGGERHFGPDWRGSGAGVRICMNFFGRYVFLSEPTDIHDISGVSAKFRRKCFPCTHPISPSPRPSSRWGRDPFDFAAQPLLVPRRGDRSRRHSLQPPDARCRREDHAHAAGEGATRGGYAQRGGGRHQDQPCPPHPHPHV